MDAKPWERSCNKLNVMQAAVINKSMTRNICSRCCKLNVANMSVHPEGTGDQKLNIPLTTIQANILNRNR